MENMIDITYEGVTVQVIPTKHGDADPAEPYRDGVQSIYYKGVDITELLGAFGFSIDDLEEYLYELARS